MKNKKLLAIVLLSLGFWFVSGAGYGEIEEWLLETKARELDFHLLNAKVNYIMSHPDSFLRVLYYYDETGWRAENFPAGVSTKGKIHVDVVDSRDVFSGKTGAMLLLELKRQGFRACYFLGSIISDKDNDIVVLFSDNFGDPLGYFYQGEYYLWNE